MKIGHTLEGKAVEVDGADYLTKKVQVLAKTDSGKTYTASKICEEMLKEKQPIVIIDPVSAYWGLKEKFQIIIFGDARNKHADYLLHDDKKQIDAQAELIADYLANTTDSAIIDLKYWVESKQQQFMAAFAARLYATNKTPRHIFIEEADIFAPQQVTYPDEINSRHYTDNIVRRGRQEGLGVTVISQRPALISKNILTQSDLSIYLNLSGAADLAPARKEIEDDDDLDKPQKLAIVGKIKKLPRGTAFFYSPRWLKMKQFVKVDKKETYHAGATRGSADWRPDKEIELVKVDIATVVTKLQALATKKPEEFKQVHPVSDAKLVDAYEKQIDQLRKEAVALSKAAIEETKKVERLEAELEDYKALKSALGKLVGTNGSAQAHSATVTTGSTTLSVVVQKQKLELDDKDPLGRVAVLLSEGFFAEPRSKAQVDKQVAARFNAPGIAKMGGSAQPYHRALDLLCSVNYDYLRKDGDKYVHTGKELGKQ